MRSRNKLTQLLALFLALLTVVSVCPLSVSAESGFYEEGDADYDTGGGTAIDKRINKERTEVGTVEISFRSNRFAKVHGETNSLCISPMQPLVTGNIADCIKENHLHECLGCRYYAPSEVELKQALDERKMKLDAVSKQLVEYIAETRTGGGKSTDVDKLLLETHSGAIRFQRISDECAEEAVLI